MGHFTSHPFPQDFFLGVSLERSACYSVTQVTHVTHFVNITRSGVVMIPGFPYDHVIVTAAR
jgi:hypothetical protein